MEGLLSVSVGTVFWASVSFLIVLILLKKMAWGPIMTSLKEREEGIANALNEAERARSEMAKLQAGNEALLREAREERDQILKEAKVMGEKVRAEAHARAQAEADRMITSAKAEIDNQKKAAIAELQSQGYAVPSFPEDPKTEEESLLRKFLSQKYYSLGKLKYLYNHYYSI